MPEPFHGSSTSLDTKRPHLQEQQQLTKKQKEESGKKEEILDLKVTAKSAK
jgi:hypothetical protein